MKMRRAEIADRYTILQLKSEHGLDVAKELEMFEEAVKDVPEDLLEKLYEVNASMWYNEDLAEMGGESVDMGELFHKQRQLNKVRVAIKNDIAKHFKEIKEQKLFLCA